MNIFVPWKMEVMSYLNPYLMEMCLMESVLWNIAPIRNIYLLENFS